MAHLRRLSWLAPLVLLACSSSGIVTPTGGGGGTTVDCRAETPPMVAYACFGDLDSGGGGAAPITLTVEGNIASVAEGVAADGCLRDRVPSLAAQASSVHAIHLRASDGTESILGLVVPNDPLVAFTVGAHLTVDVRHQFGGWGPTQDELTVQFAGGLVYYGHAGTLDALKSLPAGLALHPGAQTCITHDECGDWAGYQLGVSIGSTSASLARGVPTTFGEYTITNGGIVQQTGDTTKCADWFVADASLMVVEHYLGD